jgi:hypothetical protein
MVEFPAPSDFEPSALSPSEAGVTNRSAVSKAFWLTETSAVFTSLHLESIPDRYPGQQRLEIIHSPNFVPPLHRSEEDPKPVR